MTSPTLDRKSLEELWLSRLGDATLRLDLARNYAIEAKRDIVSRCIPAGAGNFALQKALRAENLALYEYNLVLHIYGDLTIRGVIPNEAEWLKAEAANASGSE